MSFIDRLILSTHRLTRSFSWLVRHLFGRRQPTFYEEVVYITTTFIMPAMTDNVFTGNQLLRRLLKDENE